MSYQPRDENGVIWTPTCLIRWPNVFAPSLPKGSDPGKTPLFSACAVLSGNEPVFAEFRNALWEECDRACRDKHGATIEEMRQRGKLKLAVKSNSAPEEGKIATPGFKERPNGIFFNAATQFMPPIVDQNGMGMSKDRESEVYDGIFGQIGVSAWGWSHPTGGKGVSLNLLGLIKRFDGDRLGGTQADMSNAGNDGYVPEGAKQAPAPGEQHQSPEGSPGADGGGNASAGAGSQYGF